MATALDAVGERWALLVVRELILGPRSFTELGGGLVGIATDVLTARLRSLEAAGVVHRIGEGPRRRYALTDEGRALRTVLAELARWGAHRLQSADSSGDVSTRTALTALLLDPRPVPTGLDGAYEITCGQDVALIRVRGGELILDAGVNPETTVSRIKLSRAGLLALIAGTDADAMGEMAEVEITGQKRKATALIEAIAAPEFLLPAS